MKRFSTLENLTVMTLNRAETIAFVLMLSFGLAAWIILGATFGN